MKRTLSVVEEFRRDLRFASIALASLGAKYGAAANLLSPVSEHDRERRADALCELEEAAREFTYREQLLVWAIREEREAGRTALGVLDGGRAA